MSQFQPGPSEQTPVGAPPQLAYATPLPAALSLKQVAKCQRAINLCILANIFIIIAIIAARNGAIPAFAILPLGLLYWASAITGAVFIFKLALSLYNQGLGIVLGILSLVPFLGLIVLLIVNGKATKVLRANGIHVGLLGADPATIPIDGGLNPPIMP